MNSRLTSFSYRIAQLHRIITLRLGEALAPLGIGRSQYPFLAELFLGGDGRSQETLAGALHLDKGATARALASLEADGLVRRVVNPDDRRERFVVLTARGEALRKPLIDRLRRATEVIAADFSDEERHLTLGFLDRMLVNVGAETPQQRDARADSLVGEYGVPSLISQGSGTAHPTCFGKGQNDTDEAECISSSSVGAAQGSVVKVAVTDTTARESRTTGAAHE